MHEHRITKELLAVAFTFQFKDGKPVCLLYHVLNKPYRIDLFQQAMKEKKIRYINYYSKHTRCFLWRHYFYTAKETAEIFKSNSIATP